MCYRLFMGYEYQQKKKNKVPGVCVIDYLWVKGIRRRKIKYLQHNLARTIYIRYVYTVFVAGKSPYIRSYTVCIYIRFWPTLNMIQKEQYTKEVSEWAGRVRCNCSAVWEFCTLWYLACIYPIWSCIYSIWEFCAMIPRLFYISFAA